MMCSTISSDQRSVSSDQCTISHQSGILSADQCTMSRQANLLFVQIKGKTKQTENPNRIDELEGKPEKTHILSINVTVLCLKSKELFSLKKRNCKLMVTI